MAVLFALLSSLFIGINTIVIKRCLARANAFTVAALLTCVGTVLFVILAAVTLPSGALSQSSRANLFFIVAGVFAPGLLRWIYFVSMNRVGASIASSVIATIPAFAAIIAVVFVGEHLSLAMGGGLVMVVGGIVVLQRDIDRNHASGAIRRADLGLPLVAALLGAIAINLRKLGLVEADLPILGAALGFAAALVVYLLILALSPTVRRGFSFQRRDVPLFVAGGVSLALGWLCVFYALANGPVVLVAPLASLYPLVVLVLGVFFLKDVERVTLQTVLGCCTVVAGVVVISALQG